MKHKFNYKSSKPASKKLHVSKKSKLTFHKFIIRKEDDEYIVGRKSSASYVAIPPIGLEVINLLKQNYSIAETINILTEKHNEPVEIDEFIEKLISKGFVKSINGKNLPEQEKAFKEWFNGIKPYHVRWLFSKAMFVFYGFTFLFAILILFYNPQYIPNYQDLFFHDWLTIVVFISFFISWLLIFKHELFHLFAAKAIGVNASFSLSNRLHYIVAQTDVTNLWSVDRKKRYIVYIAGIISDILTISILIFYLWLSDLNLLPHNYLLYRLSKMIILIEFLGIVFQFQFFMRTDIYYVIATKCKCKNLMQDARDFIKNKLHKILPSRINYVKQSNIPKYEIKIIKLYAILFLFGSIIALGIFILFALPVAVIIIKDYIYNILMGINIDTKYLFDGIAMIFSTGTYFALLSYVFYKRKKQINYERNKASIIWAD